MLDLTLREKPATCFHILILSPSPLRTFYMCDFNVQVEQLVARLHLLPERKKEQQAEEEEAKWRRRSRSRVEGETEPSQVSWAW